VNFAVLRSLQKAVYSPDREGHYALASDCYCHFTSPIRRYPDLTVHRLVHSLIGGKKVAQDGAELVALGEHCSEREQRAEESERELTKVKLLTYLSQRIGEEMNGIITGVEEFGLFIQGVELPAEGFVHVSSLADDYYRFDRATHTLAGYRSGNSFRLGDAVRVAVVHVDVGRRELDFRLLSRAPQKPVDGERRAKGVGRGAKGGRRRATGEGRGAKGGGRGAKGGGSMATGGGRAAEGEGPRETRGRRRGKGKGRKK
jgi:ribonuclease R